MRRAFTLGLAFLLLASAGRALGAETVVTRPWAGVTLVDRIDTAPRPVHLRVVQVNLKVPGVRVKVSPPGGAREVPRQSTLAFLRAEHAQIATNAHFFLPFPSDDTDAWVIGLGVSDGQAFSMFESPEQSYALVANAPAINIDPKGRARLVHRDTAKPDAGRVREHVTLWNAVSGSAQIVTRGRPSVPVYRDATHPTGELTPGGPGHYSNDKSWYDVATARTALGVSRDGRMLTIATVDNSGGSEGLRVGELATVLANDFNVWDALNLDGGGSTTLAWEDPATGEPAVLNQSSDTPLGRRVATSIAIFARPLSAAGPRPGATAPPRR